MTSGDQVRTCNSSGLWDGTEPVCSREYFKFFMWPSINYVTLKMRGSLVIYRTFFVLLKVKILTESVTILTWEDGGSEIANFGGT